jgi:PAS domain S-box-containing protein
MVVISLLYNLSLLISVSIIATFFEEKIDFRTKRGQLLFGIIFGLTAILGMNYPFVLEEGIIFDGRSIILSLCSFFYGPLAGFFATLLTASYRIYLGGAGANVGAVVAFSSFFIGWIFYDRYYNKNHEIDGKTLYLLGLFVHIVMITLMLALPAQSSIKFFTKLAPTVIIFYPLATVLIGKIFYNNRKKREYLENYKEREEIISSAFNNINNAIIVLDNLGRIKRINQSAKNILSLGSLDPSDVYFAEIFDVVNESFISKRKELEAVFLEGKSFFFSDVAYLSLKSGIKIPATIAGTPIYTSQNIIKGAVYIIIDKTYEIKKQKEILELSERFEKIFSRSPLPIIISDISSEKIIDVNEAFLKLFGYAKEEIVNKTAAELSLWENISERSKLINQLTFSKHYVKQSSTLLKKNKEKIFADILADFITIHEKIYLVSFIVDLTEQKIKDAALNILSSRLKLITDNMSEIIFLCDYNFNIVYANHRAYSFFQKSENDFLNQPFYSILPIEYKDRIISKVRETAHSSSTTNHWTFEEDIKIYKNEQSFAWFELDFSFAIGEGLLPNYLFVLRDITERKNIIYELNESKEKYKSIFENDYIPMIIVSPPNLLIENINKAACNFFKTEENELIDKSINKLFIINQAKQENFNEIFNLDFSKIEAKTIIENSEKIVEIFISKFNVKNENKILLLIYDITEKKKFEVEAKIFNIVIEQAPLSIFITDKRGQILYVNNFLCEQTGYTKKELIGQNPRIFKSNYHSSDFYNNLWETILSGNIWKNEILNRTKLGHLYWENATIYPIISSNEEVKYFIAIKEDISEKKEIINQLIKAREEAEKSDKLKTEFLEQISHEIRTPLNVILNFNSLIKEEIGQNNIEYASYFDSIENAGKRLIKTVELILNAAELKKGIYKPIFRKIDLKKEILDQLAFDASIAAAKKRVDLKYFSDFNKVYINGDHYSLFKVFENIIDNAIKFTNKGEITIYIKKFDEQKLFVEIKDTGIGMSEEFKKKIFEPFIQEERGYNRTFEGNGLGLFIAKKYAELNNIQLFFETQKGKGTKFSILFDNYSVN